jgi:hypothetical protein
MQRDQVRIIRDHEDAIAKHRHATVDILVSQEAADVALWRAISTTAKSVNKKKALTARSLTKFLKIVGEIREDWNFTRDDVGGPWFRDSKGSIGH